jgi:hypothetical protein
LYLLFFHPAKTKEFRNQRHLKTNQHFTIHQVQDFFFFPLETDENSDHFPSTTRGRLRRKSAFLECTVKRLGKFLRRKARRIEEKKSTWRVGRVIREARETSENESNYFNIKHDKEAEINSFVIFIKMRSVLVTCSVID